MEVHGKSVAIFEADAGTIKIKSAELMKIWIDWINLFLNYHLIL